MSRIPIRLRLTLAFALAMAVVLAATGAFLYFRLQSSLDETIAEGLAALSAQVEAEVGQGASIRNTPVPADERFVQVLAPDGQVVDSTPQVAGAPVLEPELAERAAAGEAFRVDAGALQGFEGPARLLVRPVESPDGPVAVVVGAALEDRDETLRGFLTELLLIGPAALLATSLLGYGLASAALRPVEAMRAEAAAISGAEPGRRLPLPESRDEIRRLGETLNAMLGRLQGALERERSFVADASHELRTPLALLKTELELALRHPRRADELEQALHSAAGETERLVRLAEDLLVLARSDQGRLALHRESVQANDLLAGVAERFGAEVEVVRADGLDLVGDQVRLEQALGNLVDNALRHGAAPVKLSASARNGSVELHVRDEGPGFPPEFLPRAFERFSRPDEARSGQGAGLGLALAQAIAVAHGGSAGAANRSGRGADVWLVIPAGSST
ncbi:MAG TPA: ATP-binding protein [Gaiellaceae bacterium]|nr:ATP-binding protein [Gaiellaceae bacterium]